MECIEQVNLLDLIIAKMPGHVYWKSPEGYYLGCNQQKAETLGFSRREDIINKTDFDLPWKAQAERIRKIDAKVLSSNQEFVSEEQVIINDEPHIFLSRKVPLVDANNKIIGILGISFDITESKQMEEELKSAKEEAEVANTAKAAFIRNMEHDIRTPLSGVIGVTGYLAEQESDTDKKSMLIEAHNATEELMNYCNTILEHARDSQYSIPIIEKPFDIRETVSQTLIMSIPAAKHKNLKLLTNISKNVPLKLIGDVYRIKRILVNLIGNAIKFTERGHIRVSMSRERQSGDRHVVLRLQVEDTGIGIPPDKQDAIYEKFSKVNPSNQGVYKGTGLGLRSVKQYIQDLDGDIYLSSTPNEGSTFILDFPLKTPLVTNNDKRL